MESWFMHYICSEPSKHDLKYAFISFFFYKFITIIIRKTYEGIWKLEKNLFQNKTKTLKHFVQVSAELGDISINQIFCY